MATLTVETGDQAGKRIEVNKDRFVIGRSSTCDLVCPVPAMSGQHCCIALRAGRRTIQDLNSSNGTRLNDAPVREARLKSGDRVSAGGITLRFEDSDEVCATVKMPAFVVRKNRRWRRLLVLAAIGLALAAAACFFVKSLMF